MEIGSKESIVLLKEFLSYDPKTGIFVWLKDAATRKRVGKVAGTIHKRPEGVHQYREIYLFGRLNPAHRLAFLYMTGRVPEFIDHKNGDGLDNRWKNLRECTKQQNNLNRKKRSENTSGSKGVGWHPATKKWRARIMYNGKSISLGLFYEAEDAARAYTEASREIHGEFAFANSRGL